MPSERIDDTQFDHQHLGNKEKEAQPVQVQDDLKTRFKVIPMM